MSDALVLAGPKDKDWLVRILLHAVVFVAPNAGWALSEAALAAAPVVAYDIDWQRNLIGTGVRGALVGNRDGETATTAAERFPMDRLLERRFSLTLRNRALEMLDPTVLDQYD